jgi:lariat debranching enzyme
MGVKTDQTVTVAVEGCCHGALDSIYQRLHAYETASTSTADDSSENNKKKKIDLLLICGDFQALRNAADLHTIAVPPKYRTLGDFYKYYNGEKVAPYLTIFIGGNHEASQYLSELYYGGWVAPNIYYLGAAGVVRFRGLRIAGISGIYKFHDYNLTRFERPPYDESTLRSIYHYRNIEIYRLSCLRQRPDIVMTHDWPQGIEQHGDTEDLLRRKPFFRDDIQNRSLGSPPAYHLLKVLKPRYWVSAHLHVHFTASVVHREGGEKKHPARLIPSQAIHKSPKEKGKKSSLENDDLVVLDRVGETTTTATSQEVDNDGNMSTQFVAPERNAPCVGQPLDLTDLMTQFLSLDKCLPRRQCISILHIAPTTTTANATAAATMTQTDHDINHKNNVDSLEYDLEWLAILRKTHHLSSARYDRRKERVQVPTTRLQSDDLESEMATIRREFADDDFTIPTNFQTTVPQIRTLPDVRFLPPPMPRMGNPQTDQFLNRLHLSHLPNLTIPYSENLFMASTTVVEQDENEILIEEDVPADAAIQAVDENEIVLDMEEADDRVESQQPSESEDSHKRLKTDESMTSDNAEFTKLS